MAKVRIKMLRSVGIKPGTPEKDQRHEGQEYEVKSREARELFVQGLAIDLDAPPPTEDDDEDEEGDEDDEEETDVPAVVKDGLDAKTIADLAKVAAAEGIAIQARTKPEIVAEIRAARRAKAGS